MARYFGLLFVLLIAVNISAQHQPEFSTAGFYQLENTGREVFSMNVAWRFKKGVVDNAHEANYDDNDWEVVALPHGIDYLPLDASGCINYQGEVWYRKHFTPDPLLKGKKLFLHFEAIMGKSKVWVNGQLVKEHFGGFLPAIVDISSCIDWKGDNVIAVLADNSNDRLYPPGKPQEVLDFAYFGGIYRDCWLVAHNNVFITDANYENEVAGGGLLIAFKKVTEEQTEVTLKAHIRNALKKDFKGILEYELINKQGQIVANTSAHIKVNQHAANSYSQNLVVRNPQLWSPDHPYLYDLVVKVKDANSQIVDGYRKRIGIRSIEFKGDKGFWLNGKPYPTPLMGANRHQDFAILGNALSNSLHWRDAKKLRDVGLKVIRNAHYPQDPAFMDACDELGLFVIVNTPGWQFWNTEPVFEQRVYNDIRNMVRRDRNHPSVWLWEPILNETSYPDYFAKNTREIVDEEFPYPGCYSASDSHAKGSEFFDVQFKHPYSSDSRHNDSHITYFTREWGDNVDDWNSHNSTSRVNKAWGEQAMLIQAQHYAKPEFRFSCYDAFYRTTPQHVGGCLWHAFDHQRGYHPDPFYGGLMDAYRQPKYSYELFKAQRSPNPSDIISETGPMVYIAHEMTPFSSKDVTVYSNCEEVRLQVFEDGKEYVYKNEQTDVGIPNPIIVFNDVYNFQKDKARSRKNLHSKVFMRADGYINGKKVASHRVEPARRPEKLLLWVDDEGIPLQADGSDCVTIVAAVVDKAGNIKHLNNSFIRFSIEGEGQLIGDEKTMSNPCPVNWGIAPILVQAGTKPGKIIVTASFINDGIHVPLSAKLELQSIAATHQLLFDSKEWDGRKLVANQSEQSPKGHENELKRELDKLRRELNEIKLKEVEEQQEEFGEKK